MSKQIISATIDKEVKLKVEKMAKKEKRSFSQMVSILLDRGTA